MKYCLAFGLLVIFLITACNKHTVIEKTPKNLEVYGHWVTELNGQVMLDPQPSGLKSWRGGLLTLSDRSAVASQRLKLRKISTETAKLNGPDMRMSLSTELTQSCFAEYISNNPDLEALAVDPDDDKVFYIVTEDATHAQPMSESCQHKYLKTGSTNYPTLLIRLELQSENSVFMTHVRPIQFTSEMHIGDFPNDGIEALTFGKNRTLYLGIEKDQNKHARIFSLQLNKEFWFSDDFAKVSEVMLKLPKFEKGNHPINGMDYYQPATGGEFLLAAARNDESLWVVDLAGEKETLVLPMTFYAEIKNGSERCEDFEKMDNSSIEGVAVEGDTLWLINDPWKAVYLNNIRCTENRDNFQKFAPLLFSVPIQPSWFE